MDNNEKKMCDIILKYGNIIEDNETHVREYTIKLDDSIFHLVKVNGEWVHME